MLNPNSALPESSAICLRDEFFPLDHACHPKSIALEAYRQECLAAGGFVMGRHVPHRRIFPVMRRLAVHEPVDGGTDLRARITSAMSRQRFGREVVGERLSTLYSAAEFAVILKIAMHVVRSGLPTFMRSRTMRGDSVESEIEIAWLPISAPDLVSVWLLVGLFPYDE